MREHALKFPDGTVASEIRREIARSWSLEQILNKFCVPRYRRCEIDFMRRRNVGILKTVICEYLDLSLAENEPQNMDFDQMKRDAFCIIYKINTFEDAFNLLKHSSYRHVMLRIMYSQKSHKDKLDRFIEIFNDASKHVTSLMSINGTRME